MESFDLVVPQCDFLPCFLMNITIKITSLMLPMTIQFIWLGDVTFVIHCEERRSGSVITLVAPIFSSSIIKSRFNPT
jgi:hypothetical protein